MVTSAAGAAVGGAGVAVAGGGGAVAGISATVVIGRVGVISDATGKATAGVGVKGLLIGSGVLVGRTIQAMGVESTLSKVGGNVRGGRGKGRRCLASCVKAVLKMI
jgi:hypothetical protein